jgi:hypothetical protein
LHVRAWAECQGKASRVRRLLAGPSTALGTHRRAPHPLRDAQDALCNLFYRSVKPEGKILIGGEAEALAKSPSQHDRGAARQSSWKAGSEAVSGKRVLRPSEADRCKVSLVSMIN